MIVVEIGTNDWIVNGFTGFQEKYQRLLSMLPADVPIIVSSIPPVGAKSGQEFRRDSSLIRMANMEAKQVCQQHTGCRFLDMTPHFSDAAGNLAPLFDVGDGVHLSTAAYRAWIETLREMMK
jgi:lysophospholipase L1-like esterase